jgi:hypothetical protein
MKLIAAPELRARLGMAGREIAERRFSNDAMMRNTVAVYDQLRGIT